MFTENQPNPIRDNGQNNRVDKNINHCHISVYDIHKHIPIYYPIKTRGIRHISRHSPDS